MHEVVKKYPVEKFQQRHTKTRVFLVQNEF